MTRASLQGWAGVCLAVLAIVATPACSKKSDAHEDTVVDVAAMDARLDRLQQCRLDAAGRSGITPSNFAGKLADKGVLPELQADAMRVAAKEVRMFEGISAPRDDVARVGMYMNALSAAEATRPNPPETKLQAKALLAYYETMLTGDACPLDADILKYIDKTEP